MTRRPSLVDFYKSMGKQIDDIVAQRDAQLKFLEEFVENFEPCNSCDGEGKIKGSQDACGNCGGIGLQIKSRGVLLSELLPKAHGLIARSMGNTK